MRRVGAIGRALIVIGALGTLMLGAQTASGQSYQTIWEAELRVSDLSDGDCHAHSDSRGHASYLGCPGHDPGLVARFSYNGHNYIIKQLFVDTSSGNVWLRFDAWHQRRNLPNPSENMTSRFADNRLRLRIGTQTFDLDGSASNAEYLNSAWDANHGAYERFRREAHASLRGPHRRPPVQNRAPRRRRACDAAPRAASRPRPTADNPAVGERG